MSKKTDKATKVNGSTMNVEEVLKALPLYFKANVVPLLLGHTGVGKTEIMAEYAAANNMDLIPLYVSQLEPSDFIGLFQTENGRTKNCPPNWLPWRDATEPRKVITQDDAKEMLRGAMFDGVINPNGGIVFLDEVNRGHEDIRQALYQFIAYRRIHTYALPKNYHIVAAANPTDGYEVYDFDAALINRFAWIRYMPEAEEVFKYLAKKHGASAMLGWLKSDPKLLELGDDDFSVDGIRLSPRMAENSLVMWNLLEKSSEGKEFQRKVLETMVVPEKVQSFLAFQEELKHCTWQEVLQGKKREKVKELVANNRLDVISTVVTYLGEWFAAYEIGAGKGGETIPAAKEKEYLKNAVDFLAETPDELVCTFIDLLPRTRYVDPKCIINDKVFRDTLKPKLIKYAHLFQK